MRIKRLFISFALILSLFVIGFVTKPKINAAITNPISDCAIGEWVVVESEKRIYYKPDATINQIEYLISNQYTFTAVETPGQINQSDFQDGTYDTMCIYEVDEIVKWKLVVEVNGEITITETDWSDAASELMIVPSNHSGGVKFDISNDNFGHSFVVDYASASAMVYLELIDQEAPVITGTNAYEISYNETLDLDDVAAALTVTDNVDESLTATLVDDGYTANKAVKGTYEVTYNATDSSGNVSETYIVSVNVIDNIKPIISGPNTYVTDPETKLLENNIRQALTAVDGYDGALTIALVKDNYSSKYTRNGTYTITYRAIDESYNSTDYIVTVTVTTSAVEADNIDANISIDQALGMTVEEIIAHLVDVGDLLPGVTLTNYDIDEAETDYDPAAEPGDYVIVLTRAVGADESLQETVVVGVQIMASTEPTIPETPSTPVLPMEAEEFLTTYGIYILLGIAILVVLASLTNKKKKR